MPVNLHLVPNLTDCLSENLAIRGSCMGDSQEVNRFSTETNIITSLSVSMLYIITGLILLE